MAQKRKPLLKKTQVEIQIEHHEKLIAETRRKAQIKQEFDQIIARQRENNEMYKLEVWKDNNSEYLEKVIAQQKAISEMTLKNQLATKRMEYIKHSYVLGVDLSIIREVFKLTDDEEMALLAY